MNLTVFIHKMHLDRWTESRQIGSAFPPLFQFSLTFCFTREARLLKRQRCSIFFPSFVFVSFALVSCFLSDKGSRGRENAEKQRQYFTGPAQSSSTATQYLQPTAMRHRI